MKQIAMDGEAAEFRMELRVGPSPKDGEGARTWIIRYSGPTGAAPVRDYVLKPESGTARGFVVDERSGIVIDHFLGDRVLYAAFQVADSLVHVRYAVQDDRLDVEMVTYSTEKPRRTRFPDGSFQVDSFPARVVQRGVLERVEEGG